MRSGVVTKTSWGWTEGEAFVLLRLACTGCLAPVLGACYVFGVRIFSWSTLRDFGAKPEYADAAAPLGAPLGAWYDVVNEAQWKSSADVKSRFGNTAAGLGSDRMKFDIGGGKYRLIAKFNFGAGLVFVRFIGTHKQYDAIDAMEV